MNSYYQRKANRLCTIMYQCGDFNKPFVCRARHAIVMMVSITLYFNAIHSKSLAHQLVECPIPDQSVTETNPPLVQCFTLSSMLSTGSNQTENLFDETENLFSISCQYKCIYKIL